MIYIFIDKIAIQGICDMFDNEDRNIRLLVTKLLSALCWHSSIGFEKVVESMEEYRKNNKSGKPYKSIWEPILISLRPMIGEYSNDNIDNESKSNNNGNINKGRVSFEFCLYSIGLINAILNSFQDLKTRVKYRNELDTLGFNNIVSYLEDILLTFNEDDIANDPLMSKMEEHLELYQTVKIKDTREITLNGELNITSPKDLFSILDKQCINHGYVTELIHILQCLTTIPKNANKVWSNLEKLISLATAPMRKQQLLNALYEDETTDDTSNNTNEELKHDISKLNQNPENSYPSFEQLKVLLTKYDDNVAIMETNNETYKKKVNDLDQQISTLKYQIKSQTLIMENLVQRNAQLKKKLNEIEMENETSRSNSRSRSRTKNHDRSSSQLKKTISRIGTILGGSKPLYKESIDDSVVDPMSNQNNVFSALTSQSKPNNITPAQPPMIYNAEPISPRNAEPVITDDIKTAPMAAPAPAPAPIPSAAPLPVQAPLPGKAPLPGNAPIAAAAPVSTEGIEKYIKMKKMGIPLHAIQNTMKKNGVPFSKFEAWLNSSSAATAPTPNAAPAPVAAAPPKEVPEHLKKFMKMHKMKIPIHAIKNAMVKAGVKFSEIEPFLGIKPSGSNNKGLPGLPAAPRLPGIGGLIKKGGLLGLNALPKGMKRKQEIKPKNKMRNLHWTKVKPKDVKGTIWESIDDEKLDLDFKDFEEIFGAKKKKPTKKGGKKGGNNNKSKPKKKDSIEPMEQITLVDDKRSYNVDIGMSRFKMSYERIRNAILIMDEDALDLDKVTKLLSYIPTPSEQDLLKNFTGNTKALANTEKFFHALCDIPNLQDRMKLWQFKLQFNELVTIQSVKVNLLRNCHDTVKNSKKLKMIFTYILGFGNYMNGSTSKGQAYGFKLASLRQLMSAKSTNNKINLLQYLVSTIEIKNKDLLTFYDEFSELNKVSKLDVSELNKEINNICNSLNKIKILIDKNKKIKKKNKNKNDLFDKVMQKFYDKNNPQAIQLKKKHEKVKSDCKKLAEYFDNKNDIKFEFFNDIYIFSESFKNCYQMMLNKRKAEQDRQRKIQAKKDRDAKLNKKKKNKRAKTLMNLNTNEIIPPKLKNRAKTKKNIKKNDDNGDSSPGGMITKSKTMRIQQTNALYLKKLKKSRQKRNSDVLRMRKIIEDNKSNNNNSNNDNILSAIEEVKRRGTLNIFDGSGSDDDDDDDTTSNMTITDNTVLMDVTINDAKRKRESTQKKKQSNKNNNNKSNGSKNNNKSNGSKNNNKNNKPTIKPIPSKINKTNNANKTSKTSNDNNNSNKQKKGWFSFKK